MENTAISFAQNVHLTPMSALQDTQTRPFSLEASDYDVFLAFHRYLDQFDMRNQKRHKNVLKMTVGQFHKPKGLQSPDEFSQVNRSDPKLFGGR